MNRSREILVLLISVFILSASVSAQTFPTTKYFDQLFRPPQAATRVPGAQGLDEFVTSGKLTLGLQDVIRLMLMNNTEIRINQLQYEQSLFAVQKAYGPFDPVLTASARPQRSTSPTTSTLQGAQTLSDLEQPTTSAYSQTFQTGTNLKISFNTNRSSSNNSFATFNPAFSSGTTFSLSQSLLRGRGLSVNRAPITVAQRNVKQSKANFEAQLNESILNVINQYWDLVQAQKNLSVLQDSLRLGEESYKRDKRALELGALSPLEIYRSEGTVAQRRLQVIQAEYAIKPLEDQLRRTIGADLDSRAAALDVVLTENAEPAGELMVLDLPTALELAMSKRPELEAVRQQLANDDTNVQVATNNLKPDLNLSGFYASNGRGGNQIDTSSGTPVIIPGGFTDSLDQLGSFNFPTYGVSLELRLPLRNRAAKADLSTALISKKSNLYQLRLKQQTINQDVRNAVHKLEEAKLAIAAAGTSRDLAKKTLAAEQRKYELGAQTIFFVLDAQNVFEQAEQSYVQSLIGYQRAVAAFDRATGNLLERNRVLIEDSMR
jgi:outer membrane protein TolC